MVTAVDDVVIDFSTSCSKNVAVAKLLGWMQGPLRKKFITITDDGISDADLRDLHTLEEPIKDLLLEKRQAAQRELDTAYGNFILAGDGAILLREEVGEVAAETYEPVIKAINAVEKETAKIYQAAKYIRDIEEELSLGEKSALRIDPVATLSPDDPYITLNSLAVWAYAKYEIKLDDGATSAAANEARTDLEKIKQLDAEIKEAGKSKSTRKADNSLLITLGLVFKAYVEKLKKDGSEAEKEKFFKGEGDANLNMSEFSAHFENIAAVENGREYLDGQQGKSIKNRLSDALKALEEALPQK